GKNNAPEAAAALAHGFNVAVPFTPEVGHVEYFRIQGQSYPVFNADYDDDRTQDPLAGGWIAALKQKRVKGNPANNGFFMETNSITWSK
ncbi:MAG: hypothetical protein ACR2PH_11765, partial [Desulfobulbia bacterium]